MQERLNIVVTGDIDSGKSTLIGRFLYETNSVSCEAIKDIKDFCQRLGNNFEFAYLLDSFEEEREERLWRWRYSIDTLPYRTQDRRYD